MVAGLGTSAAGTEAAAGTEECCLGGGKTSG